MNGAWLGSKYLVEEGKTVQTVTCSFCGSSCSRHGSITPWPLSASPRCFAYHSRIWSRLADLKKTPPIPRMRPRCSILTGGFDFSGYGDCTSCPPFKQAEMSSSELSAIVLQGIPCMRGLYTVAIPMEKTGRRGKLATSHSPARRGGSLAAILLLQALRAVAPDFRAGNRDFHVEIARDLFLQLFVQAALEFAHFPASQASHMNVIPRPMRFVVMPVAAQMQQIQLVN